MDNVGGSVLALGEWNFSGNARMAEPWRTGVVITLATRKAEDWRKGWIFFTKRWINNLLGLDRRI